MRFGAVVTISLAALCWGRVDAQIACPWLTEGTAAVALGGTPKLSVKLASPQEGSCVFTSRKEPSPSRLDIIVLRQPPTSPALSCPANSLKLIGIGNESIFCRLLPSSPSDRQLVLGRVRSAYFSIVLTTARSRSRMPAAETGRDAITMIAEQVAGNLF